MTAPSDSTRICRLTASASLNARTRVEVTVRAPMTRSAARNGAAIMERTPFARQKGQPGCPSDSTSSHRNAAPLSTALPDKLPAIFCRAPACRAGEPHRMLGHQLHRRLQPDIHRGYLLLNAQNVFAVARGAAGRFFRLLPLGQVCHAAEDAGRLAGCIPNDEAPVQHMRIRAVLAQKTVFVGPDLRIACYRSDHAAAHAFPVFWMDAVRPRITARKIVVRPPSEQRSQPLVPAKLVGLEMIVPDRIGSGLDQASEAFLAFAQCLLRPLALGDVGDIPFQREQHARFVIHSGALLPHPLLAAIGSDQPVRDLKTAARIDRDPDFVPDVFTVSRMDEFRIPDLPVS